jgi:hypothetical protein
MVDVLSRTSETVSAERSHEPFPGPRPFREDERELFYGRSRETAQLRSMVLASSLVVLYSPSGAGKSSLIHAGLVPALRKRGATVYPVLRIRPTGDDQPENRITNPYVRALAGNWAAIADLSERTDGGRSHAGELAEIGDLAGFVGVLAEVYDAVPDRPRVLIIDQFEELFTFQPEHWEKRAGVFEQIEGAIAADPGLSVLLAMREDYIAQTDPYAELVSNHLRQRFRIETLREPQALEAIQGPLAGTGRKFVPGAAEALVRELMQIRIDRGRKDRRPDKVPGEYVEPVQLQVVCRRFWEDLPDTVQEITEDDVAEYADVDEALMRFYNDAVRSAASTDLRVREGKIRAWIAGDLITAGETRGTVHRDAAVKKGVSPDALDELVNQHLLKTEWRNGSDWYEITHDRLIDPIRASNRRYQDKVTSRRFRALGAAAVLLLGVIVATVFTVSKKPSAMVVVTRTTVEAAASNPFPLVAVPGNGRLYQQGKVFPASYSCPNTSAGAAIGCNGTVSRGQPIDTDGLGSHSFSVTATYGPSATTTSRSRYTVVTFASRTFQGNLFNIAYPSGWKVENAEAREQGYTDTTIAPQANADTLLRVDVSRSPAKELRPAVDAEVRDLARESGYRLMSLQLTRFKGDAAMDWRFVIPEGGVPVEKEDLFFNSVDDHGNSERFAVLTETPMSRFGDLADEFRLLRDTIIVPSVYHGPNCGQPDLAAEDYSLCELTTGENCPARFAPQVEPDGTDVCENKKS